MNPRARVSRLGRRPTSLPIPSAPVGDPVVDKSVRCSCTSPTDCPEIGSLSIPGYASTPLYCNQLHGRENPGVITERYWYYQCVELANRWLTKRVGSPLIEGNAGELCDNASSRAYDVHRRGSAYEPVPGDLLVWSGGPMGHVAVVTSVSPSSMVVANQNYGEGGRQTPFVSVPRKRGFFGSPHDGGGLRAKCVIHPKRLVSEGATAAR